MNKERYTKFRPKHFAELIDPYGRIIPVKYLYTSGLIHTYTGLYGLRYIIHENGTVLYSHLGEDYKIRSLSLPFLSKILKHDLTLFIYTPEWEHLLNKRGYSFSKTYWNIITLGKLCEERTQKRINSYEYMRIPPSFPTKYGTGAHISTLNPNLIAYYPDNRHISEDRAVQIKPGRYLKKYFPKLTDDEVRVQVSYINGDTHLEFYSTFDDIYYTYRTMQEDGIVSSCMAGGDWDDNLDEHPLQVYHDSDVELAVLVTKEKAPIARALYNKHTEEYPMIYGYWEKMSVALNAAGFIHGTLDGAKINKLPSNNGGLIMPYIDGHRDLDRSMNRSSSIDVYDDHCIINQDGDHNCNSTGGHILLTSRYTCECCGRSFGDEGDAHYVGVSEDYVVCGFCFDRSYIRIEQKDYDCFYVHERNGDNFIYSDYSELYFENESAAHWHDHYKCEHRAEWYPLDRLINVEGCYYCDDLAEIIFTEINNEYVLFSTIADNPEKYFYDEENDEITTDTGIMLSTLTERPSGMNADLWNHL